MHARGTRTSHVNGQMQSLGLSFFGSSALAVLETSSPRLPSLNQVWVLVGFLRGQCVCVCVQRLVLRVPPEFANRC